MNEMEFFVFLDATTSTLMSAAITKLSVLIKQAMECRSACSHSLAMVQ